LDYSITVNGPVEIRFDQQHVFKGNAKYVFFGADVDGKLISTDIMLPAELPTATLDRAIELAHSWDLDEAPLREWYAKIKVEHEPEVQVIRNTPEPWAEIRIFSAAGSYSLRFTGGWSDSVHGIKANPAGSSTSSTNRTK
jgi:hypothetical protein